jgi:hypothetical protein
MGKKAMGSETIQGSLAAFTKYNENAKKGQTNLHSILLIDCR